MRAVPPYGQSSSVESVRWRTGLLAGGACAACLAVTAAAPTAAPRLDYAGAAWSILPTGEDGGLTLTKHSTDQAKLYDALTPKAGNVSAADLPRDLKPERLSPVGRTTVELIPRHRLRALRDRFGVAQPPSAEPPPPLGSRSLAEKRYLMTPGPTPVPPQVLAALAQPVVHHRGPDFRAVLASTLERLRRVHRTKGDVLLFTASGTAAMESAAANLLAPGDRVLVVSAGYFGERWAKITRAYGADVQQLAYEWGETPSPDDLAARLVELGDVKAVFLTQSETSTGVVA